MPATWVKMPLTWKMLCENGTGYVCEHGVGQVSWDLLSRTGEIVAGWESTLERAKAALLKAAHTEEE